MWIVNRDPCWHEKKYGPCSRWSGMTCGGLLGHGDLLVQERRAQAVRMSNMLVVVTQVSYLQQHDAWRARVEMMVKILRG